MENLLFLVMGWLLGLFGPLLTDVILKPYRRAQIRSSLFVELRELRFKVAGLAFLLACHNETVNRALLEWVYPIMSADKTLSFPWFDEKSFKQMLDFGDDQLQAFASASRELGQSPNMKKISLPYLTSQVGSLHLFSDEFQRAALEILGDLAVFNEDVESARLNFEKTFDGSISQANQQAIHKNLQSSYRQMEMSCKKIAQRVNYIFETKK
jgi:hypothetical protein